MPEGTHDSRLFGTDAATEQEGRAAVIGLQYRPVEGLSRTAGLCALRVEQIVVAAAFVGSGGQQVVGGGYGKGFDDAQSTPTERAAIAGRFVPVQLYSLQTEAVSIHQDFFFGLVDEDAHALCPERKIVGQGVHEAWRTGIEDEPYPVYAQLLYLPDVVAEGHAADFAKEFLFHTHKPFRFCKKAESALPGWGDFIKFSPMRKPR